MALLRFTTSRLSELRAAGRLDELQHATIAPFLERELGPEYGRLFADFEAESSDLRAWYTDAGTAPQPIAALDPSTQEALRQQVADMIGKVTDFAARIAAESTQKANLARILTAATTFPIEDIWRAGEQPVIVNWGFHRHNVPVGIPQPIRERIRRPVPVARAPETGGPPQHPIPAAVVVPATSQPRAGVGALVPALLWLLFVLLVAGSYRLLLPACGLRWPIFSSLSLFQACDATATSARLAAEGSELQRAVDQAELDLTRDKTACVPAEPRRAEVPPPQGTPRLTDRQSTVPPARIEEVQKQVETAIPRDATRGEVEVSLIWHNTADLDLIIDCPGGEKLWRNSPDLKACGGRLLRDMNTASNPVENPIEHAAWPSSPGGRFTIKVELYGYNRVAADTDIPFTVRIKRGARVEVVEGHIKGVHALVTAATTDL